VIVIVRVWFAKIQAKQYAARAAATNGSPRGSPWKSGSARDATPESGGAMMQLDESTVVMVYR